MSKRVEDVFRSYTTPGHDEIDWVLRKLHLRLNVLGKDLRCPLQIAGDLSGQQIMLSNVSA